MSRLDPVPQLCGPPMEASKMPYIMELRQQRARDANLTHELLIVPGAAHEFAAALLGGQWVRMMRFITRTLTLGCGV